MKRTISLLVLFTAVWATAVRAAELKSAGRTGDARLALAGTTNPLKQGKNILTLTVKDAKTGRLLAAEGVKVETTMSAKEMDAMGMKDMGNGSARTEVTPAGAPGRFAVKTTLPFGGNWQMKVSTRQPAATAVFEVPVK